MIASVIRPAKQRTVGELLPNALKVGGERRGIEVFYCTSLMRCSAVSGLGLG